MWQRNIQINKFTRGIIRDGVDDPDYFHSLRNLQNYDIDYTRGQLVKRDGTARYHTTALSDTPQQVYHFMDKSGNEYVLCICNTKLYLLSDAAGNPEIRFRSTTPSTSLSFTNGEKYPFITIGDRYFFADDNDVYWVDSASLSGPYYSCYQVGIDKPTFDIESVAEQRLSHEGTFEGVHYLDITDYQKVSQSFTPSRDMYVDAVRIQPVLIFPESKPSSSLAYIISLYTDSGGYADTLIAVGGHSTIYGMR